MQRKSHPFLLISLAGLLGSVGCDSGEKKEEPEAPTKTAAAAEEETKAEASTETKEAKEALSEKDAEIAALKAEIEAAKEAAEAAKAADPEIAEAMEEVPEPEEEIAPEEELDEGEKGPVSLANVRLETMKAFGKSDRHSLKLLADVTVNEKKDGGVYAKASCVVGEDVFVNVVTVSNHHGEMGKMSEGDTKHFDSYMFSNGGLPEVPSRCQLKVDYGSSDFSVKIATHCWDGKEVKDGACEEAIEPVKKGDGAIVPFGFAANVVEAPQFSNHPESKKGKDRRSVELLGALRFNDHFEKAQHLHIKSACKVGEKTWTEVSVDYPHIKPFAFEDGEAVTVYHKQFFLNSLPAEPEHCDISVYQDMGYKEEEKLLTEMCLKEGAISEGVCVPPEPPAEGEEPEGEPEPEPLAADTVHIDETAFVWNADFRDKAKKVLAVHMAATVKKPHEGKLMLRGKVECDGKADREHNIGPDLGLIKPGQTVAATMLAFHDSPFAELPKQCSITVMGQEGFGSADKIVLGGACIEGEEVKDGPCGSEAAEGEEAEAEEAEAEETEGEEAEAEEAEGEEAEAEEAEGEEAEEAEAEEAEADEAKEAPKKPAAKKKATKKAADDAPKKKKGKKKKGKKKKGKKKKKPE